MPKLIQKSVVPLYGVAAVWLLWALLLPMYALWHFLLVIAASAGTFFVLHKLCPDKVIVLPDPPPEPKSSGNPEVDALMAERDRAVSEMRRLNDSIEDVKVSAKIDHMELMTGKIIDHVAKNPQKLPQIRRFMDYYLPTTLKLLNAYDRMDDAGVAGTNIDGTMGKIDGMLDQISTAFDKQMDALFADEALDIDTDITVMEQLLGREGIGGAQMPGL